VQRFSFVLFIHHCKTVIKGDQELCFYPSKNDRYTLYQKYLKKTAASLYLKLQKERKLISKVLPVSSFAPRISGLHTFGRINNDFFAS